MGEAKLENWTVGDRAEIEVTVDDALVASFTDYSGDRNPLHVDAAYAETTRFKRRVAHGMSYASLFSRLIGNDLPGSGALWLSQNFRFAKPAFIGDRLRLSVEVAAINATARTLELACRAVNQLGDEIMTGTGEVMLLEAEEPAHDAAAEDRQRVAIVTGGSRGIGAAIARRLAADGFAIAVTARSSLKEAEALCGEFDHAMAVSCDSADAVAMAGLADTVSQRFGPVDTVILNASDRDLYGAAADGDFTRFSRHFETQIAGPHALVSACLESMKAAGRGTVIGIGSTFALGAPPAGMAPYVVAKTALEAYIRCLAADYGPQGIRANLVAPSMTETALLSGVPDRTRKVAAAQNPMRRLAMPEDVAGAVAFLASDDASYVNGHVLTVSGGGVMT